MRRLRIAGIFVLIALLVAGCGGPPSPTSQGVKFAAVSVGAQHACALDTSGNAYCWGDNSRGELGDGTTNRSYRPVKVSGGLQFSQISAGNNFTCGIGAGGTSAGVLYCWGDDNVAELGDGNTTGMSSTPVMARTGIVNGGPVLVVSTGSGHACELQAVQISNLPTGYIACWGNDDDGQVGIGQPNGNPVAPPQQIGSTRLFAGISGALSAGGGHTCAIGATNLNGGDGDVLCWGSDFLGETGPTGANTCTQGPCNASPVGIPPGAGTATSTGNLAASQVTSGGGFSCARTAALLVYCWGNDSEGELGIPPGSTTCPVAGFECSMQAVQISGMKFSDISAGDSYACGIAPSAQSQSGNVLCWGTDLFGQLGVSTQPPVCVPPPLIGLTCSATPTAVSATFTATQVSAGEVTACALSVDQTIYCWGDNSRGQLGTGSTATMSLTPVQVMP